MILRATDMHGIFLNRPPSGCSLPGIHYFGIIVGDCCNKLCSECRYTGEPLQEIKSRPFTHQNGFRTSLDLGNRRTYLHSVSIIDERTK